MGSPLSVVCDVDGRGTLPVTPYFSMTAEHFQDEMAMVIKRVEVVIMDVSMGLGLILIYHQGSRPRDRQPNATEAPANGTDVKLLISDWVLHFQGEIQRMRCKGC